MRRARGLALWMARAKTSLPVPGFPLIITGTRARAAFAAIASAVRKLGDEPMISSKARGARSFSVSGRSSPCGPPVPTAVSSAPSRRSGAIGFCTKSLAPARIAATASSTPLRRVMTISGSPGRQRRSSATNSGIAIPGAPWSTMTASSVMPSCVPSFASAVSVSGTTTVRHPPRDASADRNRCCAGSLSTIISVRVSRLFAIIPIPPLLRPVQPAFRPAFRVDGLI